MSVEIPVARSITFLDDGDPPVETTNRACIGCTLCPFIFSASNTGRPATVQYVAFQFQVLALCTSNRTLQVFYDAVGSIGNQFQLFADGVNIFDSGCFNGSGGSGFANVPVGTKQFDALVYGACNGSGTDLWSFSAGCI